MLNGKLIIESPDPKVAKIAKNVIEQKLSAVVETTKNIEDDFRDMMPTPEEFWESRFWW